MGTKLGGLLHQENGVGSQLELEVKGPNSEFDMLVSVIFDKVISRLLRSLESEGRTVKPSLVHGDLWYANSGVDVDTGESLVFNACCFYAHNECKLDHRLGGGSIYEAYICTFNKDEFGQ